MKMEMVERESSLRKVIRTLCLSNGWSYGVFWRFDNRNPMLLNLEEAYYQEVVGTTINSTLQRVHMLGEGIIGQAALNGKHRWTLISSCTECESEFSHRLFSGIKTVVIVPVESQGVVEFGSTEEVSERPEFIHQTRKLFQEIDNFSGIVPSESISSSSFYGITPAVWEDTAMDIQTSCVFDSACLPGGPFNLDGQDFSDISDHYLGDVMRGIQETGDKHEASSSNLLHTFDEQCALPDLPESLFPACPLDELPQWFADSPNQCLSVLDTQMTDAISQTTDPCTKGENLDVHDLKNSQLNALVVENGVNYQCLGGIVGPTLDEKSQLGISTSVSECISEVEGGFKREPRKRLFSELGLEKLFSNAVGTSSLTKSCIMDPWSGNKKRGAEICSSVNLMQRGHRLEKRENFGALKEQKPKSQVGLWVDDSYSIDAKSCITTQPRRSDEPAKPAKKRARPGESTRPRPKDRQMIADRIKDLREIIPNGAKYSIDMLLGKTIKHMLFLQNLTKYAEKLKQVHEPKLIGGKSRVPQIDRSLCSTRGATWALQVGSQNMFCPIIVEDLSQPGLMLIEMLCEDHGLFLEIAGAVRGFGLTILKGVMEARQDKIWAHFIVEANRHVTRMDIFVALMQLLQDTDSSRMSTNCETDAPLSNTNGASFWSNYQQNNLVPLPLR